MPTIVTAFVVVIGGLLAILYRAEEKVPRLQDIVSSFVGLLVFRLDDGRSLDRLSLEEIEAFATLHYN
jgi:hypothetical protein